MNIDERCTRPGASIVGECVGAPHWKSSEFLETPAAANRVQRVLDRAEAFVESHAVSSDQRRSIGSALGRLRCSIAEDRDGFSVWPPFIHLPLLVYEGLLGEEGPAIGLAVATTLLFLGLDLFDDVADGDWPAVAPGCSVAEVNLTAATLLCALPQLAIAELDAPSSVLAAMQRTLARGLLRMSAGQQQDLASVGAVQVRSSDVETAVVAKSGEETAVFARLGAQLAQAPDDLTATCEELGRCIGAGGQLASDCYELFTDPAARDFAHGARTLPIALHLERLEGEQQAAFLALLEQARQNETARGAVRSHLRTGGQLRHCAFIVETYRQRALRMCRQANLLEPARSCLEAMIGNIGFFPTGGRLVGGFWPNLAEREDPI